MELKKTVEVINHVWSDDLDALIFHHYGRHYDYVKFHDLPEDRLFPIETYVDKELDDFDQMLVEKFISGEFIDMSCIHALLSNLCKQGFVEPGYYLIGKKHFE